MPTPAPEELLRQRASEFKETFELLPDAEERMRDLIQLGRSYPAMEEKHRVKENLLAGCISQLWIHPELRDGLCYFQMDADALTPKGTAALLCGFYNGIPAKLVATIEPDFIQECGLGSYLTPSRQSGLSSLRRFIRGFAEANA
jgi:cysteine desulfuration protein SufE